MYSKANTSLLNTSVSLAAVAVSSAVAAQDAPAGPASAVLEEVVVSAQKRDLTAIETPSTVQILSATTLQNLKIDDLEGINKLVPGFTYERDAGSNMALSIRGVGTTPSAQSLEQSVSPYVDGVYLGGNNRDFAWPLFDVDHIEVLKGTQSGIAGQNASVGVINIITRKPGTGFGGYASAGIETEFDGSNAEAAMDLPVADTLRVRVAGYYDDEGGWVKNAVTQHDLGDRITYAARLNAIWDVGDKVSVGLYTEYDHMKLIGSDPAIVVKDPTGGYAAYVAPYFTWRPDLATTAMLGTDPSGVNVGGDSGVVSDSLRGSATVTADLGGGFTLTSITAASQIHDDLSVDLDVSPADIPSVADPTPGQWLGQTSYYHQVTEEVRLASPTEDRFSYIVGLWYRHADVTKTANIDVTVAPGFQLTIAWPFAQETKNASVFGDVEYRLSDTVRLGGTLRYTDEHKTSSVEGVGNFPATFPPFPLFQSDLQPTFWDGSVRVQYEPNSQTNLYALYSHGTKTGALIDLVASGLPQVIKPEVVETCEVGTKFDLLNSRLRLDLAAFHMLVTDYQDSFTAFVGGTPIFVASNTDVRTNGVDASLYWQATAALALTTGVEYLDARDETNGGTFLRSPEWQITGNARYSVPLAQLGAEAAFFANYMYKSDYFNVPQNDAQRNVNQTEAYSMFDIGAEFSHRSGLSLSLLCANCGNTYAAVRPNRGTFGPSGVQAIYAPIPELRTITLRASYKF